MNDYRNCIAYAPQAQAYYRPQSEAEIIAALLECHEKNLPVYPFSAGNNWGYGSKAPLLEASAVMDLSDLREISFFDAQFGLVRVQPGVTYGQLSEFLIAQGDQWMAPVHGGGPDCSVMGNVLERGFGITPIEDHFSALQSLRAILADGSIYESPLTSMGNQTLCAHFQWGIGPYLDGIFTQSGFGVVTEICLRLAPKPEHCEVWLLQIDPRQSLRAIVDRIRRIQQIHGANISGINLMNQARMASMLSSYPHEKKQAGKALSATDLRERAQQLRLSEWTLLLSLQGSKATCRAVRKQIGKELGGNFTHSQRRLSATGLAWAQKFLALLPPSWGRSWRELTANTQGLFDILQGRPNHTALRLAYWMNETDFDGSQKRPDLDDCGLIWYSPIVPMRAEVLEDFLTNSYELAQAYDINPLLTFTSFNALAFECTWPILFNKNIPDAGEKAQAFYRAIYDKNAALDCLPYRMPLFAMDLVSRHRSGSFALAEKIKQALDPQDLIAPGRYLTSQRKK